MPTSSSAFDVNCERLWVVAELAGARGLLPRADVALIRETLPAALHPFPGSSRRRRSPPGWVTVSGTPVGTFLRSALLIAGQKALGRRFDGHPFFENVERDLALGVMRSHFHHEYPKGTHCCVRCTLAAYPVLKAGAIRFSTAPRWQIRSGGSFATVSGDSPDWRIPRWCSGPSETANDAKVERTPRLTRRSLDDGQKARR